jgi:hypothetical protein
MSAQIAAPPGVLEKIQTLIESYNNNLVMNRMSIEEFCMAEKNGLVQVLIILNDAAKQKNSGFDYQDNEIIRQMLEIVPDRMNALNNMALSPTRKKNIEKEVKKIISAFIDKPCKEYLRRFPSLKAPSKEDANKISTPIGNEFREAGSGLVGTQSSEENLPEKIKMEKTKELFEQFKELTDLLLEIRTAVYTYVSSNQEYSKALSVMWGKTSSRTLKKDYKNLMDDIRNYIPDIPDDKWEGISAAGARLSDQIEKLIDDFTKITDRKTEIQSTMNNLRSEYKTLWINLWEVAL